MKSSRLLVLALYFVATFAVQAQTKKITAVEAKDHVGEVATVCGQVASTRYAEKSKGQPTFINLDKPYPNAIFTILIWGDDRSKFGAPESKYHDANVCATGKISSFRGTPEIVAREPSEIVVQK